MKTDGDMSDLLFGSHAPPAERPAQPPQQTCLWSSRHFLAIVAAAPAAVTVALCWCRGSNGSVWRRAIHLCSRTRCSDACCSSCICWSRRSRGAACFDCDRTCGISGSRLRRCLHSTGSGCDFMPTRSSMAVGWAGHPGVTSTQQAAAHPLLKAQALLPHLGSNLQGRGGRQAG